MKHCHAFFLMLFICCMTKAESWEYAVLQVGENREFQKVQDAIDASTRYKKVIVLVDEGTYEEKLFISRNHLAIVGVSPENTIFRQSILRKNWREQNPSDWGAAVININASDVSLINLTVMNDYGRHHGTTEHQFAIRGFENADRVITKNCRIIADGNDTLSLWNKHGRYYHSNCYFSGHTDMVCPRGTALIEESMFYNHNQSATLWHDGELDPNYKLVVVNSKFDGVKGFQLGRHHYDAQFYLLNSAFSERIANAPIFKKRYPLETKRERPNLYGARYFFEANLTSPEIKWARDNFRLGDIIPTTYPDITAWVYNNSWSPNEELKILKELIAKAAGEHPISPIQGF